MRNIIKSSEQVFFLKFYTWKEISFLNNFLEMCSYYERQFFLCCIPKVGSIFTDTNKEIKLYSFEFCTFCKIWNPDQVNLVCSSLEIKLKLITDKSTLQFFTIIYYFLSTIFTIIYYSCKKHFFQCVFDWYNFVRWIS